MSAPLLKTDQLVRQYLMPRETLFGPAPLVQALNGDGPQPGHRR